MFLAHKVLAFGQHFVRIRCYFLLTRLLFVAMGAFTWPPKTACYSSNWGSCSRVSWAKQSLITRLDPLLKTEAQFSVSQKSLKACCLNETLFRESPDWIVFICFSRNKNVFCMHINISWLKYMAFPIFRN